ncbi:HTH_48 domain-containing protein [Caerostris extrusa]|uniref:HTH_48 domain-containing protein n=1 Tax=Caerostris extrusa TaxID=172846 RepID=A0AAV4P978_CAEEX|nr:HTH_48 domain-containing protein [Caerostris extrusa]
MLLKQEKKIIRCVWRCIDRTPVPKLVCTIFFPRNFDVEDVLRSNRPFEADEGKIKELFDTDHRITTREIAEKLNLSNSTFHYHVKCSGLISKLGIWVANVLVERNLLFLH